MAWPTAFADGNLLTAAQMNAVLAAISTWGGNVATGGYAIVLPTAAPVDANIPAGGCVFWLDEVTHKLMCRIKYSNGVTLKTATISLT